MKTKHFHSARGCLSYVTYNLESGYAALIDPSKEIGQDTYLNYLYKHGLTLSYIIETHTHADHISIAKEVRNATNAPIVRHKLAPSPLKDIPVDGGRELMLGTESIKILATPGHTNESISLYNGHEVFTGDALLIGGTGRTDFQVGDSKTLYHSIHDVLAKLPPETLVRPGHDYAGRTQTVLGEELATNPRVLLDEDTFIHTMDAHHPPTPDLFEEALKRNSG
jgi:glyoxylase-like metal-dependent hydrolase (beta-lactamase superfamily II)